MSKLDIRQIPVLNDNYVYLAHCPETGATAVVVTHDAEEAMRMADTIALLKDGELAQIGTAEELYNAPSNLFVARFFAEMNVFNVRVANGSVDTPLGCFAAGRWGEGAEGVYRQDGGVI